MGQNLRSREAIVGTTAGSSVDDHESVTELGEATVTERVTAPASAAATDQSRTARSNTVDAFAGGESARVNVTSRRDAIYNRALAAADTTAAAFGLLLSMIVVGRDHPVLLTLAASPLMVAVGRFSGVYDRAEWRVRKSTLDEAPRLFHAAALFAIAIWLINGMVVTHTTDRHELVIVFLGVFLMSLILRAFARWGCRHTTRPERCLVIGDQRTCERMRAKLAATGGPHATVAAQVVIGGSESADETILALTDQADLRELAVEYEIDRIIIAPERADAKEVLNLIRTATSLGIKVSVVPRLLEVIGSAAEFDDVQGVPLLSMRRVQLSRSSCYIKRALDVVGSTVGLILLSPLLALISLAIKLDSPGTVLYRQHRIGRDGKSFEMLKFRTMVTGAHERRDELMHLNEAQGLFKIDNDPRVTRVGAWLRRLSLDELPQLFNVLRGEMSLVGPRPLIAEEDRRIQGWDRRRLQLTPGMTGHWQILGSARIPLDEMVKIDYLYVTNWSLWLDVKILLRTIAYIAGRKGM
jgi:exopolysaccharide biosynthesis polyprenyl glycosylphosphotransferase